MATRNKRKISSISESINSHDIDAINVNPKLPTLLNKNLALEIENYFQKVNIKTQNNITVKINNNNKNKKRIMLTSIMTYKNLITSFKTQCDDSNIEFISVTVLGCLQMHIQPTISNWINSNEGRSLAINCFIDEQQKNGYGDIKIAGLSDYSFDVDFSVWTGGNILEIKCKNKNYEPESDTDIDE